MTRNIRVILPIFLLLITLSAVGNCYHGNHLGGAAWITDKNGVSGTFNLSNGRLIGVAPYGNHRPYTVTSLRFCR